MPQMKKVIEELKARELRDRVKVMVGNAPVNDTFAEKIGADAYGKNSFEAVEMCRRFVGQTLRVPFVHAKVNLPIPR
jgi:5-methyltetrahydrofolate--homocysteine methyltransferase